MAPLRLVFIHQPHRDYEENGTSLRLRLSNSQGVALILVTFVVALATICVTALAYSTHLAARRNNMVERGFQAEYLLKSAVNLARVLIKLDKTPEDSEKDLWGMFKDGIAIPPDLLSVPEPNIDVELEIRPEEGKIPIRALVPTPSTNTVSIPWRDALLRLFENLGFRDDNSKDESGPFQGRVFSPEEMVANLIDFVDADKLPYRDGNFSGIEGSETEDIFPNEQINRFGQLASVPGFTAARLAKLQLFLTTYVNLYSVNINIAPKAVLMALDADIDSAMADRIIEARKSDDGPIKNNADLLNLAGLPGKVADNLRSITRYHSNWYQVIAKVSYGTSAFFVRAYLKQDGKGELPDISSFELF